MKKIFLLLLCMLVVLAGCAKATTTSASASPTGAESTNTAIPATSVIASEITTPTPASPTPSPTVSPTPLPTPTPVFDPAISLTSGRKTDKPYKPVCVMIENMPQARPQTGIGQADIVYEMYVENCSMTRFMCVFNDVLPKNVGPVRSARVYYVDIADEYKGAFVFFGGSMYGEADIYKRLKKSTFEAVINGITGPGGKYFWRIKQRSVPHNVYTNLVTISNLMKAALPPQRHFEFDANAVYTGDDINTINLVYTKQTVNDTYIYDPVKKNYKRYIANKPMMDDLTKTQVAVTNVIVQHTKLSFSNDFKGHIAIRLIGKGNAEIFIAGKLIKATWEKTATTSPTRYFDENGSDIKLLPGNTWVQVVSDNVITSYKK